MMLLVLDVPWWIKLWWRGVDITVEVVANLISAAIIGLVGLLLWKWNKRREQSADREEWRRRNTEEQQSYRDSLKLECEAYAAQVEHSLSGQETWAVVLEWQKWLERRGLLTKGSNLRRRDQWVYGRFISQDAQVNFGPLTREVTACMRATEI